MSRSAAQCILPSTIATPPAEGKLTSLSQGDPSSAPALRPLGKDVLGRVGGEQKEFIFQTQPVSKRGHDERPTGVSVTTSQKPPAPYNFSKEGVSSPNNDLQGCRTRGLPQEQGYA